MLAIAGALRAPAAWVFIALTALLLASIPHAATAIAFIVAVAFQAMELTEEFRLVPPAVETSPDPASPADGWPGCATPRLPEPTPQPARVRTPPAHQGGLIDQPVRNSGSASGSLARGDGEGV